MCSTNRRDFHPFPLEVEVDSCAGIFKQSMGSRNRASRNKVVVPARQATQPGGIGSLRSILRLLKSLKIRDLTKELALR
jgi:hypothetical protein